MGAVRCCFQHGRVAWASCRAKLPLENNRFGLFSFPSFLQKKKETKKKAGTSSLEKQMQPLGAQLSLVNKLQDEIKPNKAAN